MAKFGEILAELRQDHGLTQKQLAKELKVSTGSISAYERGKRVPTIDLLVVFADYFNVGADYMLGRTANDLSPAVFCETYTGETTIGDLIEMLRDLPPESRQALALVVNEMQYATKVRKVI